MEKNIDKFFQTAEKDDSLKEKYNQIKNQKSKKQNRFAFFLFRNKRRRRNF